MDIAIKQRRHTSCGLRGQELHGLRDMPDKEDLMQFFGFDHLPQHLQGVSRPFADLANQIVLTLPRNPERTTALRKLLEAKDCAVRAFLFVRERDE